jgi:hypothetical protein
MYIPNSLIVDDVNPGFRICSELELVAFRVFAEQGDGSVEAIEAHRGVDPACIGADRGGLADRLGMSVGRWDQRDDVLRLEEAPRETWGWWRSGS